MILLTSVSCESVSFHSSMISSISQFSLCSFNSLLFMARTHTHMEIISFSLINVFVVLRKSISLSHSFEVKKLNL
jgi:hypothetical protein